MKGDRFEIKPKQVQVCYEADPVFGLRCGGRYAYLGCVTSDKSI